MGGGNHYNKPTNNFELEELLKDEPHFKGVFMKDQLTGKINDNENAIVNLESSGDRGSHWVCYSNSSTLDYVLYFDSYGLPPPEEIVKYLSTSDKKIMYNTSEIQNLKSQMCGYYCVYVIKELNKGNDFYDIVYEFDPFPSNENENEIRNISDDLLEKYKYD